MKTKSKEQLFNIPNSISLLRIILTFAFIIMVIGNKNLEAFIIFLIAGATDLLDGMAARFMKQKTKIGTFLDPAADKLLLFSSYIVLSLPNNQILNSIPLWLTIPVIARDIVIAISAAILFKFKNYKDFHPSFLGKTSTFIQIFVILFVLLFNLLSKSPLLLNWIYILALVTTLLSGLHYAYRDILKINPAS